jgi:hypothetical protein
MTLATYNGRTYDIPDIWLAGFCQSRYTPGHPTLAGATILEAVAWWAWQEELKEREEQNG